MADFNPPTRISGPFGAVNPASVEVNPNISNLITNAQRSNPDLLKSGKDEQVKTHRLRSYRSTATYTDSTELSDDMMSSMDPDEYFGNDSASDFAKALQELYTLREKEEEIEEDYEEDNEEEADYGEDYDEEEEDSKESPKEKDENDDDYDYEYEYDSQYKCEDYDEEEVSEECLQRQSRGRGKATRRQRILQEDDTFDSSDKNDSEISKGEEDTIEKPEALSTSQEEMSQEKKEDKDYSLFEKSGSTSLLTYEDGFIIADPKRKIEIADESSKIDQMQGSQEQQKENIPESLKVRYEKVIDQLVICRDKSFAFNKLSSHLKLFGARALEICRENMERILLLPYDDKLNNHKDLFFHEYGSWVDNLRWGYFSEEKLVVLGEEVVINQDPRMNLAVLYFAFAFDHALGTEGYASENSAAVLSSFKLCRSKQRGHQFTDSFAAVSPIHYFARSVEAFLSSPHGILKGNTGESTILCTKEHLYDIDRSMYCYLEYLFRQVNRGENLISEEDEKTVNGLI